MVAADRSQLRCYHSIEAWSVARLLVPLKTCVVVLTHSRHSNRVPTIGYGDTLCVVFLLLELR